MNATSTLINLASLSLNKDFSLSFSLNPFVVLGITVLILLAILFNGLWGKKWKAFEMDEAEIGIGQHKISFRPNFKDQEIAYKIWVELSTRKIGLPIDLTNDVISEIYDSWYNFFSITRELIKDIPITKLRHNSTRKIIDLSVGVLNEGLRPHLTLWQARFRHWYDIQLESANGDFDPQSIQAKYPNFNELKKDLMAVNNRLIKYRERMKEMVLGLPHQEIKKPELKPTLSDN